MLGFYFVFKAASNMNKNGMEEFENARCLWNSEVYFILAQYKEKAQSRFAKKKRIFFTKQTLEFWVSENSRWKVKQTPKKKATMFQQKNKQKEEKFWKTISIFSYFRILSLCFWWTLFTLRFWTLFSLWVRQNKLRS